MAVTALVLPVHRGRADSLMVPGYDQMWQVTSYAADAGLTRQRVFDIAFAPDGVVWLAAEDGLRRFDGFDWERFGTEANLPSAFTRAVCVTAKGDLWVGSGAGAGIFDFKQKQYNPQGSASGLANGSVREIDEDPDGSLWFSCDQWPDASAKPGGLTRLKNGQWQTFSRSNGLPMDYVIGYFRDSTGRRFAMTPHGWTQEQDGRWGPPLNPGWEAEDCVLQMAEAGDGTLFAQGEHGLLVLKDGRWQSVEDNITRVVCATRDGQMAAVEYNGARGRLWFSLWDGNRFVRASAPVACQSGARFYHLREAPDGSLWCVGFGTVVRWAYRSGQWAAYPQLPPPVGTDKLGRVWFAGESNVVVCAGGQFKMLPPGKLAAWSPAGLAMVRDAQAQQLMVTDVKDPAIRTPVEAGCESVTSIKADGENGFWFCGEDGSGNGVVAHYRDGKTSVIAPPEFQGRQLMSPVPGPPDKLWVVAHYRDDVRYDLALVSGDRVEWQPLRPAPPTLTYPNWSAGAGQHWLSGYASLYQQTNPPAGDWQQVTAFPDTGFGGRLTSSNEALFAFSGGQSGRPGCGLFSRNGWRMAAGDFYQPTFGPDGETIYLSSRGGVFIRKEPGTLDLEYLPIPGDAFVGITVADTAGNLWLGTSDGVLRYQPARTPPDTKIVASATEVSKGSPLPVTFHGRSRFERENRPASFHYAWRIDGGPWSGFQPLPENGFLLPDLNPGRHRLEVRARDVDGNVDPTPAVLSFNVLPLPLQQRGWFIPLVVLLAAVLLRLTWLRLAHVRQMAATNAALRRENDIRRQTEAELEQARRELEIRVVERTAELSRANESLNREIAERKLAEESQRRLEAQLHQSQKMEAIGTLAGGIAHDFNNILAVIIPYCHLALEDVKDRPDLQENLTAVLRAADRAKHLVQQILTFSRRQYQACQVVNLEPVVAETLKLLRSALPSTIQMVQHSQPTPPVLVDTTQIHQVIMNLCINAQHAMEGRQGRLEVGLDAVLVDEALRARSADLQCGRYVRLTIRDNGCGIPPEILGRIFEPFFTTKETGRGTGLGLAVVHGIVKNYDGAILVQSRVGEGTVFEVFLPAQTEEADKITETLRPVSPASGEHILIVDDETAITEVMKLLLSRVGYHVTAFTDPQAAFKDFMSRPADVRLVLTDLTMPGMTGLELARKVLEIRPELPVVMATGFGGDLITSAELAALPNIRKVIEKPLNPNIIIQTIAEILQRDGSMQGDQ